jgi:selenium-binding protein 1
MPKDGALNGAIKSGKYADGFGYDIRALPQKNVLVTSSFTGWNNYMMDLGKMMTDPQAMAEFGNTAVIWDLHTRKPKRILDVPGAPLEIRCAWDPAREYCFTTTALTSKIWLIHEADGVWQAKKVADIGDASKIPLPVDISISADDQKLWVNTWNDGQTRLFDISNPHKPREVFTKAIGDQVNMVSQSWDGKRLYYTSSLLGNWDKKSGTKGDLQYFKAYNWNGEALVEQFSIDFLEKNLGRPHQMRFGAEALYANLLPRVERNSVASLEK